MVARATRALAHRNLPLTALVVSQDRGTTLMTEKITIDELELVRMAYSVPSPHCNFSFYSFTNGLYRVTFFEQQNAVLAPRCSVTMTKEILLATLQGLTDFMKKNEAAPEAEVIEFPTGRPN